MARPIRRKQLIFVPKHSELGAPIFDGRGLVSVFHVLPVVAISPRRPIVHSTSLAMSMFGAGLRRFAFQAPSKFFVCNQCLRQPPRTNSSRILNFARSRGFADQSAAVPGNIAAQVVTKPAAKVLEQTKNAFPKTTSKAVAYWLIGSAVSCFGIVVWGGLTRLTESGYAS